jgi:alpha-tubulin suppressor-like RCC1 family protein
MTNPRLPIAALLLVAGWGCRNEAPSPTEPASAASSSVAAAGQLSFLQVSAGIEHACGVAADGKAWCWGANQFGELGIPPEDSPFPCSSRPCSLRPIAVSGGLRFRQLSAGNHFTCGLTTGDKVFCWGENDVGQLGTGSTATYSSTPTEVAGNRKYLQVSAGFGNMACAINLVRSAFCWGSGRLGNGSIRSSRSPVKVSGNLAWLQLAVGGGYGCGITTIHQTWCWGVNSRGQLGNGTITETRAPVRSAQGFAVAQIDAGGATTCAVLTDARAFCWGEAIATGTGRSSGRVLNPTAVAGTRKWSNVTVGSVHGCGITLAGRSLCWGLGVSGALGNGSVANRFTPVRVSGEIDFVSISAGFVFSCGLAEGGKAWCWGDNSNGQVGDGSGVQRLEPVAVAAP